MTYQGAHIQVYRQSVATRTKESNVASGCWYRRKSIISVVVTIQQQDSLGLRADNFF